MAKVNFSNFIYFQNLIRNFNFENDRKLKLMK